MMMNDEGKLDDFFQSYYSACVEPATGPEFMPSIWRKIEARQSFWFVFARFGKQLTTAFAALCLLLLALNWFYPPGGFNYTSTYADALMADHSAERTYYAEAIRNAPPDLSQER